MAEFQSPRFAGDPLLEEVLNDPDTGMLKLQPGSPPDSVMALQQALFDLAWNLKTSEPVLRDSSEFVIGIYGPKTTEAVTAFKSRYDIHFPPSAPTGLIDGFAGPRTLAKLDAVCVALDESIDRISAKAAELQAAGLSVSFSDPARRTTPVERTSGTFSPALVAGTNGGLYFKRGLGEAHEVHGNIFQTYLQTGPTGPLGFPITDEDDLLDLPGFRISHFEHGRLRCELKTGVVDQLIRESAPPETEPIF